MGPVGLRCQSHGWKLHNDENVLNETSRSCLVGKDHACEGCVVNLDSRVGRRIRAAARYTGPSPGQTVNYYINGNTSATWRYGLLNPNKCGIKTLMQDRVGNRARAGHRATGSSAHCGDEESLARRVSEYGERRWKIPFIMRVAKHSWP